MSGLQSTKCLNRSIELSLFLAFALPSTQFGLIVKHRTNKHPIVIRATHLHQFIMRRTIGMGLKQFLQFALGIV